jgi:hypothetical protein
MCFQTLPEFINCYNIYVSLFFKKKKKRKSAMLDKDRTFNYSFLDL